MSLKTDVRTAKLLVILLECLFSNSIPNALSIFVRIDVSSLCFPGTETRLERLPSSFRLL